MKAPTAAPTQPATSTSPAPVQQPLPAGPVAKAAAAASSGSRSETPPVRSASASLETVERAINDLRISSAKSNSAITNGQSSGGDGSRRVMDHRRRGGRRAHPQNRTNGGGVDGTAGALPPPIVPKEDFDFDRANSKFDKASIYASAAAATDDGSAGTPGVTSEVASPEPGEIVSSPIMKEEPKKFYDRSKSFFDNISSDAKSKVDGRTDGSRSGGGGRGRGGGGGGRGGRSRRDEERTKNLTTFGETGIGSGGYGQWQGSANGGATGNPAWRGGRRRRSNNVNHGQVRWNFVTACGQRWLIFWSQLCRQIPTQQTAA